MKTYSGGIGTVRHGYELDPVRETFSHVQCRSMSARARAPMAAIAAGSSSTRRISRAMWSIDGSAHFWPW